VAAALALACLALPAAPAPRGLPPIAVAADGGGFVERPSARPFVPWGFNYDHDAAGRLLEDYWETEWPAIEGDFREMRALGANTVRVHLQFGRFMRGPAEPDRRALAQFARLLRLAERERLYLDVTGLGCYHKADVPAWYDRLDEAGRWAAQERFWTAVAGACRGSSAVFCHDLMNEPVVPGGRREPGDWLGPPFAGKHFVQVITLDQADRPRPQIARAWTRRLAAAVRAADPGRLVTVGLVDWSLDRPGLTSGFVPAEVAPELDFLAVHHYPESGKQAEALEILRGFQVGKPVVVEETFPLNCTPAELERFIGRAGPLAAGWVSFYWGTPLEALDRTTLPDALLAEWLPRFMRRGPTQTSDGSSTLSISRVAPTRAATSNTARPATRARGASVSASANAT